MPVNQSRGRGARKASDATLLVVPGEQPRHSRQRPELDRLLDEISGETAALNQKLIAAVRLLARMNAWTGVVRLLVGVGNYQMSEIATATGVMRSTVTRWFNGETSPQRDQTDIYLERLVAYMTPSRPFDLTVDPASLVGPGG